MSTSVGWVLLILKTSNTDPCQPSGYDGSVGPCFQSGPKKTGRFRLGLGGAL